MKSLPRSPASATLIALLATFSITLAGCGKGSGPGKTGGDQSGSSSSAAKKDDGLPSPKCPARFKTEVAGPDINGLKLGLTRDEALNAVRCSQPDGVVADEARFFSQMNTGSMKLGPQQFTVQSGETAACKYGSMSDMQACGLGNLAWKFVAETVTVAAPGIPGRETVVGIWRTQNYKPGDAPAAETVQQALIAKYGPPQLTQKNEGNNGWLQMFWLNDPAGQPISPQNPLMRNCPSIHARGDDSQQWSEACGMSITAMLKLARDNPLLVGELSVGMVDQAKLYAYGNALQEEILALEQKRKEGEVKDAKDNAAAPKL